MVKYIHKTVLSSASMNAPNIKAVITDNKAHPERGSSSESLSSGKLLLNSRVSASTRSLKGISLGVSIFAAVL